MAETCYRNKTECRPYVVVLTREIRREFVPLERLTYKAIINWEQSLYSGIGWREARLFSVAILKPSQMLKLLVSYIPAPPHSSEGQMFVKNGVDSSNIGTAPMYSSRKYPHFPLHNLTKSYKQLDWIAH